jgi:hypothetical protein
VIDKEDEVGRVGADDGEEDGDVAEELVVWWNRLRRMGK